MSIEEIRQRRAAIDGAPWKYASVPDQRVYGTSPGGCNKQVSDYPVCEVRGWGHLQYMGVTRGDAKAQAMQDANGLFIAHAPGDVDYLMSQLERANSIIGWMMPHIGVMCPPVEGLYDLNQHCFENRVPDPGAETKGAPLRQTS